MFKSLVPIFSNRFLPVELACSAAYFPILSRAVSEMHLNHYNVKSIDLKGVDGRVSLCLAGCASLYQNPFIHVKNKFLTTC